MEILDWIIMLGMLLSIVVYGVWYICKVDNVQSYLLGDCDLLWWMIGFLVMAM